MTQENKELLLKDLCARLPYGIYANLPNHHLVSHKYYIYEFNTKNEWTTGILYCVGREQIYGAKIEVIQPYLRPMSSMAEEESKEYRKTQITKWVKSVDCTYGGYYEHRDTLKTFDWLNAHHFDYRGLIEKGLALEAPKDMYEKI